MAPKPATVKAMDKIRGVQGQASEGWARDVALVLVSRRSRYTHSHTAPKVTTAIYIHVLMMRSEHAFCFSSPPANRTSLQPEPAFCAVTSEKPIPKPDRAGDHVQL